MYDGLETEAFEADLLWHGRLVEPCPNCALLDELSRLRERIAPTELAFMREIGHRPDSVDDHEKVADMSFDCIMCGLCASRCPAEIVQYNVALLARRSLPLVVTISDPDVHAAVRQYPHHSLAAYQRTVAGQLLDERQVALDNMRRQGVLTLDVPADQLSLAVINRYLELKARTMI